MTKEIIQFMRKQESKDLLQKCYIFWNKNHRVFYIDIMYYKFRILKCRWWQGKESHRRAPFLWRKKDTISALHIQYSNTQIQNSRSWREQANDIAPWNRQIHTWIQTHTYTQTRHTTQRKTLNTHTHTHTHTHTNAHSVSLEFIIT